MTIVAVAALFSVVGFYAGVGLDYLPNDPWVLAIAFLLTTAVATFASGVAPFTKQFFPLVGMGLYIVLSVPAAVCRPSRCYRRSSSTCTPSCHWAPRWTP